MAASGAHVVYAHCAGQVVPALLLLHADELHPLQQVHLWCWEMSVVRSGVDDKLELTGSQDWDLMGILFLPLLLSRTDWCKTALLRLRDQPPSGYFTTDSDFDHWCLG